MDGLTIALILIAAGSALVVGALAWNAWRGKDAAMDQATYDELAQLEETQGGELVAGHQGGQFSNDYRLVATAQSRPSGMRYNPADHRTGLTQFSNLSGEAIRQVRQAFADLTGLGFDVAGLGVESYDPQQRGTKYVVTDYMAAHARVIDLAVVDIGVDPHTCQLTAEGINRIERIALEYTNGARKIQR